MPARLRSRLGRVGVVATVAAVVTVGAAACSNEPERSVANYCSQVDALATLDADLASGDPVKIEARATDLRLLQQVAPPEIEPSVVILLGVTDDFARTAGTATDRSAVVDEVFRGRSDDIESIEAAGNELVDYTASNCQIALDGGSTSVPGSATAPPGSGDATQPTTTSTPTSTSTTSTSTTAPTSGAPTSTTTSTPSLLVD